MNKIFALQLGLFAFVLPLLAADTNSITTPKPGDNVPAPGPRDRAYGISGPGAKHTAAWTNYNLKCTGAAVKAGLIPNLKPLIIFRTSLATGGAPSSATTTKRRSARSPRL